MNSIDVFILAGGQGRRMDYQDKGLVTYLDYPLIQHVIDSLAPQTDAINIIANRNIDTYRALGFPVYRDIESGFHGPLMGMLTAMSHSQAETILFVPCDTPHLPHNLIHVLNNKMQNSDAEIVVAIDDTEKEHAVTALMKKSLAPDLQTFLSQGERKVMKWNHSRKLQTALFDAKYFTNINSISEI